MGGKKVKKNNVKPFGKKNNYSHKDKPKNVDENNENENNDDLKKNPNKSYDNENDKKRKKRKKYVVYTEVESVSTSIAKEGENSMDGNNNIGINESSNIDIYMEANNKIDDMDKIHNNSNISNQIINKNNTLTSKIQNVQITKSAIEMNIVIAEEKKRKEERKQNKAVKANGITSLKNKVDKNDGCDDNGKGHKRIEEVIEREERDEDGIGIGIEMERDEDRDRDEDEDRLDIDELSRKGGRGTFSVGCLPKPLMSPKGNVLFPGMYRHSLLFILFYLSYF